ncbi:ataxin-1 [Electrophorus electricus]|uniref:ataxin-1 n=1 Tax=Electrophorus electricus TaxID=8005 RepID=UPI0015D03E6B|nr:ataxin-1 [Electrophorus electricus]XP_026863037.2 ataxin-1 [Electrophorus electricus]
MKSNQERSNECLPPKKREILALEERQVLVASTVSESQSGENLAWLASVATMASMASVPNRTPSRNSTSEPDGPCPSAKALAVAAEYLPSTSACSSSPSAYVSAVPKGNLRGTATITANPAVLSSSLPQAAGPIQHAQLPPNIQIIGPYTGYISSQIVPAAAASPTQSCRSTQELYATTAVIPQSPNGNPQKQHMMSSLPSVAHTTSQCIQVEGAPVGLTVTSPSTQVPLQLHPHSAVLASHGLALAPSQVLVHYADGLITKHPDSQSRDLQNGALGEVAVVKHGAGVAKDSSNKLESDDSQRQNQNLGLQAQTQVLLPADYATHDGAGLQTSLMLLSGSHLVASNSTELQSALDKDQSSLARVERTGLSVGKPVSRVSSLTLSSADGLAAPLAPTLSSHALLQTSPCAPTQDLSTGLYSAAQLPIIGYITSASGGPQQVMASYHSNLPQHLVISSNPSLLIPVSAGSINTSSADPEVTRCSISTITPSNIPAVATGLPQAYITTATSAVAASVAPNDKEATASEGHYATAAVQSSNQVQLPVLSGSLVPSPTPALTPAPVSPQSTPLSPSSALPPYFMKGSIIQLADGELKRVEDLRAEDFLQSADLSGELKIDSSTVERIDSSRTPDAVIIQFSVGEHKTQVCVEVLVEYPFFVFGQGWSSCCPHRTTQLLALSCARLSVGDVCISLTLKSLRNGVLRKDQPFGSVLTHNTNHVKTAKTNGQVVEGPAWRKDEGYGGNGRAGGEQNREGIGLEGLSSARGVGLSKEGEGQPRNAGGRKRRWSAPERGEMGRSSEGILPETLPKMSFLSQEVKISIEGRSSMGS